VVILADDFGAWLVGLIADAGRKKLTTWFLGSDQERALRQAATAAIQDTSAHLDPLGGEQAEHVAMVIAEVFRDPKPGAALTDHDTLLQALHRGVAANLAVLDDPTVTGTGQSSAEVLGVSVKVVADVLTNRLVREIMVRGSGGGPLAPLADQLNHDRTFLQGMQVEGQLAELAALVRALAGTADALVTSGKPTARSVYLRQVEQIFPFDLVGRDAELADLEAFCAGAGGCSYMWWQGPAWAGKSALMAWFVLHRPAGVRVVSFFITARFAGQGDRTAFLEVMLDQLADLAGKPVPDALTESNRQAWFLQLLADAAEASAQQGQRLVLLVDGLDEDRGVTSRPDGHSIAALLPAEPPTGVRIIVAGRPDPAVPADVPPRHPLRDASIVRQLDSSPHADMVRDDAERELDRLLDDEGPGRRLLGLVTAARGGLSRDDLVELSGEAPRTVDRTLRSVLGRTFHGRQNRWRNTALPVFVLAHENLQQSAAESMSRSEIEGFVGQLHAWADSYRQQGWPAQTPEYLLRGYHRLMVTTGDVSRMTALATDRARLDRMLDISGGDAAGLAELVAAQEFIVTLPEPDLAALLDLAVARDQLTNRNSVMPPALPAVWARIGHPVRAEALARSIPNPPTHVQSMSGLAEALAAAGDLDGARRVVEHAEKTARSVADVSWRAITLAEVTAALAAMGEVARAEAIVRDSITEPFALAQGLTAVAHALARLGDTSRSAQVAREAVAAAGSVTDVLRQPWALADAAASLAAAGDFDHAVTIARGIGNQSWQARALARLAQMLSERGEVAAALEILPEAEALARTVADPAWQALAVASVARAWGAAGDTGRAVDLAGQAEATASAIGSEAWRSASLGRAAEILARLGMADQAVIAAGKIANRASQAQALTGVAAALAEIGDHDRALEVLRRAEIQGRRRADLRWSGQRAGEAAKSLAKAGAPQVGEAVARAIEEPAWRARALASVAIVVAAAGDVEAARRLAGEAEASAARATGSFWQSGALDQVARAFAVTGDAGRAEAIARSLGQSSAGGAAATAAAEALAGVAEALAQAGAADQGEALADSIGDSAWRTRALIRMARVLSQAGDTHRALELAGQAETAARPLKDLGIQLELLAETAEALAEAGETQRGTELAAQAQAAAKSLTDLTARDNVHHAAATALARTGDLNSAQAAARCISSPTGHDRTLASIVRAAARAGRFSQAEEIARSLTAPVWRAQAQAALATVLATKTGTLEHPAYRTDPMTGDPIPARIGANPAGERFRRLLAAALVQPSGYSETLPLLAQIEPAAVIRLARDVGHP
jgi:tetratricopeptide (TPR) repeat protein